MSASGVKRSVYAGVRPQHRSSSGRRRPRAMGGLVTSLSATTHPETVPHPPGRRKVGLNRRALARAPDVHGRARPTDSATERGPSK